MALTRLKSFMVSRPVSLRVSLLVAPAMISVCRSSKILAKTIFGVQER